MLMLDGCDSIPILVFQEQQVPHFTVRHIIDVLRNIEELMTKHNADPDNRQLIGLGLDLSYLVLFTMLRQHVADGSALVPGFPFHVRTVVLAGMETPALILWERGQRKKPEKNNTDGALLRVKDRPWRRARVSRTHLEYLIGFSRTYEAPKFMCSARASSAILSRIWLEVRHFVSRTSIVDCERRWGSSRGCLNIRGSAIPMFGRRLRLSRFGCSGST